MGKTLPPVSSPNLPLVAERGDDFLERVLRVCQLREEARKRRVDIVRKFAPRPLYEHAEIAFVEESGEARTFALAATPGTVSEDTLDKFIDIHREYRRTDPWTFSMLVFGGDPPDEALVQRGRQAGVHVRSFIDFQGLVDFRPYLERQNRRLENDPIYPPRLYVEQRMRVLASGEESEVDDALSTLEDWLYSPYGRFILLLGDFGTGKTFLMHELGRRLGRPRGGSGVALCPVFIELRALEKAQSLDALVAQHLASSGMDRIDLKAFRYMLTEGRVALLFDGFDELALRVTYERAVDHFDTLLQAAQGNAKVVITSRTQHFLSEQQVRSALAEKAASLPGYRVATLSRFSEKQIKRYLVKKLDGDVGLAEARFRLLGEVKDLLGLSQNPRMLSFIAEIPDADLLAAREREGEITAAALYQILISRWLEYEFERAHPRGGAPGLTAYQRWSAVEALARKLWQRSERSVNVSELPEEVALAVTDLATRQLDPKTAAHQVGSGTLLVRDDRGNFSFIHQSVLEWLVARAAADEILNGGAAPLLLSREMTPLMADFFASLSGEEAAVRWAQGVLREGASTDIAKRNAQLVLQRLGVEAGRGANLAGQNLRGRKLTGQNLRDADLTQTDLSEALLERAVLSGANLRGARLKDANLTQARLEGADLSGAELSFACLLGADLRGAQLTGTRFRAAKLVGARIDSKQLEATDHFGAAPPEIDREPFLPEPQAVASSPCRSVAFRPDGDLLATAHDDGSVRIWEIATGKPVRAIFGHDHRVNSVAWSPSGHELASAGDDGTVRIRDAATGRELLVGRRRERVRAVTWSPDGSFIAGATDDRLARIWSFPSGKDVRVLRGHLNWVRTVAFSPDGKKLATGSEDGRVRLWDAGNGAELGVLSGHGGAVLSVAWTPGGTLLASGAEDATLRVWDVPSGKELRSLSGHHGSVRGVAWSPDGRLLASAGEDKTVRVWDMALGEQTAMLGGHNAAVNSVAWSPDGKTLASGSTDRTARVWDVAAEKSLRALEGHLPHANFTAWSPDGRRIVQGAPDNTLRVWEVKTAREIERLSGHEDAVHAVAWSPDGKLLATGATDGALALWTSGHPTIVRAHERSVRCLAFSPGNDLLASGSKDRTAKIWDAHTSELLHTIAAHRGTVVQVAFSPDGRTLATASTDNTVRLFDSETAAEITVFEEHSRPVQSVAWAPGGRRIASSADDTTVRIWEPLTRRVLRVLEGEPDQVIVSLAWDLEGRWLAGGGVDGHLRLWDATTAAEIKVLRGHGGPIWSLGFSPDGRLLASGANDGTVKLWDPEAGTCLATLVSLPEGWVAYAPDGRYKLGGNVAGAFWHVIGLCRFEPGELEPFTGTVLRVADEAGLFPHD